MYYRQGPLSLSEACQAGNNSLLQAYLMNYRGPDRCKRENQSKRAHGQALQRGETIDTNPQVQKVSTNILCFLCFCVFINSCHPATGVKRSGTSSSSRLGKSSLIPMLGLRQFSKRTLSYLMSFLTPSPVLMAPLDPLYFSSCASHQQATAA